MSRTRTIAAFLIAPLMAPLVLLASVPLRGGQFNPGEQLGAFVFLAMFAYAATIVFGIPAFFLFRAAHWNNIFLYMLVGGLIGLLVSIIQNERLSLEASDLAFRGWCVFAGALSALGFRIVSGVSTNSETRVAIHRET